MGQHDDEQEYLAPEDDWDLPQQPRPRAPINGDALAPAALSTPREPSPPRSPASGALGHASATPAEAAQSAAASGIPTVLAHADRPGLFPALAARSALFRVGRPSASDAPHQGPVPSQGGYDLSLFGPWPRMRDKAVWEAAMGLAKELGNAAEPFRVSMSAIAARMGLSDTSGAALDSIWASLERLAACRIEFTLPRGARCGGSLLKAATKSGRARFIQVDMALAGPLFREDYQFKMDGSRRATLGGSLAQWLHDFLSTHEAQDKPLTLDYVRGLCGYDGARKSFPALLRAALAELAQKAPELLQSHALKKRGRASDAWAVELARGTARPSFAKPQTGSGERGTNARKGSGKGNRKAGPAL